MSNLEDDLAIYETTLWDIYVATGADTDGDTGPAAMIAGMGRSGFAGAVYDAVKQLGDCYDQVLDEISLETEHLVQIRPDGFSWTAQHPIACRPNLFECPVTRQMEAYPRDTLPEPGVWLVRITDSGKVQFAERVS
jgi:hypothetical protein